MRLRQSHEVAALVYITCGAFSGEGRSGAFHGPARTCRWAPRHREDGSIPRSVGLPAGGRGQRGQTPAARGSGVFGTVGCAMQVCQNWFGA